MKKGKRNKRDQSEKGGIREDKLEFLYVTV